MKKVFASQHLSPQKILKWLYTFGLCSVIFIFFIPPATANTIILSNEKMTLKVEHLPLRQILEKFARKGITVKLDPDVNPFITVDFTNREIQDVFSHITKGFSHALVWKQNSYGRSVLSEIIVFREGQINQALTVKATGKNLTIEKDSETGDVFVKNRLLIQFKKKGVPVHIRRILSKMDAVFSPVNNALGIYEITLPGTADIQLVLEHLQQQEGVDGIEPDYAYQRPGPSQYTSEFQAENSYEVPPENPPDGYSTFPVAVLDTGLMEQFLSDNLNHAAFDAVSPDDPISDSAGHGTQMALIASGQIDPEGAGPQSFSNPVISIRAFDDNGYTSNTVLFRAIDHAINNGAKVLSLSWGSYRDSRFLKSAMDYARKKGIYIVAAAGNDPTGESVYPAAYESVISVSALTADGRAWEQSNYGEFVDLAAPGFANFPVGYKGAPGTYAGTSISTAFVAGKLAAYLRDHPESLPLDNIFGK